jgi:prolyl-tRNA editing enzyme YbaK/EbsC (Cys-tRNA(Pro) deacylase)
MHDNHFHQNAKEIHMEAMTHTDFQTFIDQHQLNLQVKLFENSTATSQMAADNIGCELGQIAKSLAFFVEEQPILVIASGDQRVDDRKIAVLFNTGRKRVKIATPDQCIAVFGYAPGGIPPFGHRTTGFPVFIDDSFQRYTQLYAAGGAHNAIFPITFDELVRISGGKVVDVKRDPGAG